MNWGIVTDSSCDYVVDVVLPENIKISKVPFIINIDDKEYIDNDELDIDKMVDEMEVSEKACHTACPSPETWLAEFEKNDFTIAITISANLSGSYNSAMLAKQMIEEKYPEKKVYVLNSKSAGAVLEIWEKSKVKILSTKGLCSFYAERKGMIVSY